MRKLRTIVILLLFNVYFTSIATAQDYMWSIIGNMEHRVAGATAYLDGDDIVLVGGFSDSTQTPVKWQQSFNPESLRWQKREGLVFPRFGHVSVSDTSKLYTFGGVHNADSAKTMIESWNIGSAPEVYGTDLTFDRIYATGHIVDDMMYIIGGHQYLTYTDYDLPYIVEYSLSERSVTWSGDRLNSEGLLPEQQMSAKLGDYIYIFGGVYYGVEKRISRFNIKTHETETLAITLSEARAGGQAVAIEERNQIVIIGGYNETEYALSSVEIFTVLADTFSVENSIPLNIARSSFTAIRRGSKIFIFGGYDIDQNLVDEIEVNGDWATEVESGAKAGLPYNFELQQNYPNPFNPTTTIKFKIPVGNGLKPSPTTLVVYDILGSKVTTLVNKPLQFGTHSIRFNGSDLPSGVYFYQLTSGNKSLTKKMMLLK